MVYVPEILNARLQDNLNDAKRMRILIQELNERILEEKDLVTKDGINSVINDTIFEYQSLTKESREIRQTLKMIERESEVKKDKKKRASSLATRLNSHIHKNTYASV